MMRQYSPNEPEKPHKAPRLPLGSLHSVVLNQKANSQPTNEKLSKQQRLMEEYYKLRERKPLEKLYQDSKTQEQQSLENQQVGQLRSKLQGLNLGKKE